MKNTSKRFSPEVRSARSVSFSSTRASTTHSGLGGTSSVRRSTPLHITGSRISSGAAVLSRGAILVFYTVSGHDDDNGILPRIEAEYIAAAGRTLPPAELAKLDRIEGVFEVPDIGSRLADTGQSAVSRCTLSGAPVARSCPNRRISATR